MTSELMSDVYLMHFCALRFMLERQPRSSLFPYTTLFRSVVVAGNTEAVDRAIESLKGVAKRVIKLNRSEEHTSELQSPCNLVCRLLLEKKKKTNNIAEYNNRTTKHDEQIQL